MNSEELFGEVIIGSKCELETAYREFSAIKIDKDLSDENISNSDSTCEYTISGPVEFQAMGTFDRRKLRKIRFEPIDRKGWWLRNRAISIEPVEICIGNARAYPEYIVSNITLEKNGRIYLRLIEHIITLKTGLMLDGIIVIVESEDPPLFDDGTSMSMYNALKSLRVKSAYPTRYCTVRKTVSAVWSNKRFIIARPAASMTSILNVDCSLNIKSAVGKQRVKFNAGQQSYDTGTTARTFTHLKHYYLFKYFKAFHPASRLLGYNIRNLLLPGQSKYFNEPGLLLGNKSLEPVWHRAVMDLMAAVALINQGWMTGNIISYKGRHKEDTEFISKLVELDLIEQF